MRRSHALAVVLAFFACNEDDDVYTVEDCEADGGIVVGSDGGSFPTCPAGSSSLGDVTDEDGNPAATEGAICRAS